MELIDSYRKRVTGRYIPVDATVVTHKIMESDTYFASVKYDGHFVILVVKNKKATLYDRSGKVLSVPAITDAAEKTGRDMIVAGELCLFENGTSMTHREVASSLKKTGADLRLAVFDLLELDSKEPPVEFEEKYATLNKTLPGGKLFAIEQQTFSSRKDVEAFYASHGDKEGIVVRTSAGVVYKVKKTISLDLVILGYGEGIGEMEGKMRELLLGISLGNDRYQLLTKCGSGFTDQERIAIPKKLNALTVESEYTEVTGVKTAFIMVKPELVAEIKCLDLINETSQGPIRKVILKFDKKEGWITDTMSTTLSVISPVFVRFREDKNANENDAGSAQAYSLIEPLDDEQKAFSEKPSEIICREVYQKKIKDSMAIRKFVGLRTYKEDSGYYSPYVVIYTDLSLGRKTPLEQELFLCNNEKEVNAKVAELKEENIKKGWEPVK